ncbi:MAG: ATP-binding protein [Candidatus Cloacimonadales bacterium]|jgi:two-component system phosphate regulon sensor histidine kinase PhoR|nr:HAMP domain-containing protein [Candidatus Cloacimonadota bacterium]MDY0381601.1 ATP-binding protein [Candidatus Cloacimonadaceae bacterium]MCB5256772.1 HAMP domain-containing protein [Candidatus Cloacimonadota bacterium]MCB5264415.1 HAMP domain-containing protein [Candidatus Cloacimonadota bacterium]MCB5277566.1 HAMP domain-containing protein [Candidatus Cloacimonadota bacterium]
MEKHSLTRSLIILHIANLALLFILMLANVDIGIILPLMTLSTAFILFFSLLIINRQLHRISDAARRISRGEELGHLPDLKVAEFSELGRSINKMLNQKDSTIGHLTAHREELRLLISTNEDPLWALDPEGRVLWSNNSFEKLFPYLNQEKLPYYWEIIRDPFLLDYLREFPTGESKELREFIIEEHYYLLSAAADINGKRRVFMLQSIDELRAAQQMKRDFIVNLAHELRTPLTAIKGFTEALEDDESNKARYLKIIQNHTDRLIRLIVDLEELIRLERGPGPDTQWVKLAELMGNISLILKPMTDAASLDLIIEIEPRDAVCHVDPFKLEQVFINLAQNSIRHTRSGAIRIKVWQNRENLHIDFTDSGSGIDPKDQARIFERFWVGEPSRNRAKGGTGLGLAIVKHIVAMHGGKITVESEPGKGCTFHIDIPQYPDAANA